MTELDDRLRRRAERGEFIDFETAVEAALYDDEQGFYASPAGAGGAGRRGDFLTSVEVGPLFGAVMARVLDHWWSWLGRPDPFVVVEAAAGAGTLARTIRVAEPSCQHALRYVAVERSPVLARHHPDWVESRVSTGVGLDTAEAHVVIANELLDNLAFGLRAEGRELSMFEEIPERGVSPRQDRAAAWVSEALDSVGQGVVIALDYCATTDELASRPWREWVRTYRRHARGGDPWSGLGTQDITCEVCVDQLPAPTRVRTQAAFLRDWGVEELVAEGRALWRARAHLPDLAAMRARSRVSEAEALLDPTGLGAFTVLEWEVEPDPVPS